MATRQAERADALQPTYHAASAGGDKVRPGVTLIIKNTNGASRTCTIPTPGTVLGGLAIADKVLTIPATTGEVVHRVPPDGFAGSDRYASLVWSADSGVTFAVLGVS